MRKGFPKTRAELTQAGYVWVGVGECRACLERIEWFQTPNMRSDGSHPHIPISTLADDTIVAHFAICPAREAFRREYKAHRDRVEGPKPEQGVLFR
jgi:hypothetical protein